MLFSPITSSMTEDIWVKGYVYSVEVREEPDGRFRGQIHVKAHRYTGRVFEPPVTIETPALFKREHAAEIEARAMARELIDGGHIDERLRQMQETALSAQPFSGTSSHTE
jgi:hypothetical protein